MYVDLLIDVNIPSLVPQWVRLCGEGAQSEV